MRVAVDDDVGRVRREETFGCRAAQLVTVAHVNRETFHVEVDGSPERRIIGKIAISIDRSHGRNRLQLLEHRAPADVAGVQNQLDPLQRLEDARAH